jgi:putative DNA primase/helicase
MNLSDEQRTLLLTQAPDHEGHAQSVLALYPGLFRHNESHGWLQFNGTHWDTEGAEQRARRAITNTLQKRRELFAARENMKSAQYCMSWSNNVNGTLTQLAKCSQVYTPAGAFDDYPDQLNARNGVIDLPSGELIDRTPDHLFTYCLPVEFNPDAADVGGWLGFLESIGLSPEIVQYLQMAMGYSLTGHIREEVLFYLYGQRRSGKGTFIETLNAVLGKLATGVDMNTFTSRRYGDTSNFDLAPLKNKRFIAASETGQRDGLNPAVIKKITGGDEIYCSFKRRDHFSYRPQFKVWLTSNYPANVDVDDDAAWGRLRVIHFPRSFYGREDKALKARLRSPAALEFVLAWGVEGAATWYAQGTRGLPLPSEIERTTEEHRAVLDSAAQFLSQQCVVDTSAVDDQGRPALFTVGKALYGAYTAWCEEEGYMPLGRKRFTSTMEMKGIHSAVKRFGEETQRGYTGVALLQHSANGTGPYPSGLQRREPAPIIL